MHPPTTSLPSRFSSRKSPLYVPRGLGPRLSIGYIYNLHDSTCLPSARGTGNTWQVHGILVSTLTNPNKPIVSIMVGVLEETSCNFVIALGPNLTEYIMHFLIGSGLSNLDNKKLSNIHFETMLRILLRQGSFGKTARHGS